MGKRGPQPMGNTRELKIAVSPALDAALAQLAALSGVSKATAIRYSLMMSLSVVGLLNPEVQDMIPTRTKTRRDNP